MFLWNLQRPQHRIPTCDIKEGMWPSHTNLNVKKLHDNHFPNFTTQNSVSDFEIITCQRTSLP